MSHLALNNVTNKWKWRLRFHVIRLQMTFPPPVSRVPQYWLISPNCTVLFSTLPQCVYSVMMCNEPVQNNVFTQKGIHDISWRVFVTALVTLQFLLLNSVSSLFPMLTTVQLQQQTFSINNKILPLDWIVGNFLLALLIINTHRIVVTNLPSWLFGLRCDHTILVCCSFKAPHVSV